MIVKKVSIRGIFFFYLLFMVPVNLHAGDWSSSFGVGINNPTGPLGNIVDSDISMGLGMEYNYNKYYSAELNLGNDSFKGKFGGPDLDVAHLSINGKRYYYLSLGTPFVLGGVGIYNFDPGNTDVGLNVGAGWQWNLTKKLAIEAASRYHFIDTSGSNSEFYTVHVGGRFRF